jgi:predicted Zn-dependent protease
VASRREKIEALLADDPNDAFLRYSLAMELDKEGQLEASAALFRGLMADSQPQVAAFFMLAQQLARQNQSLEAVEVLRAGIEQAEIQGDSHAAGEMREFLAGLDTESM